MIDYTVPHYKYGEPSGPRIVCVWCAGDTRTGCQCYRKVKAQAKRARKNAQRLTRAAATQGATR